MRIFNFEIDDKGFTGGHLEQLGKVLEKRNDLEQVHLTFKSSPKVGNTGLKSFIECLCK